MKQEERERRLKLLIAAESALDGNRKVLETMKSVISRTDPLDPEFAKDVRLYKAAVNEYLRRRMMVTIQKAKIGMVGKKLIDSD